MFETVPRPGVLLSVRPRFANALLDGSKTVEIRRRPARIVPGTVCLVYATSPRRALVGAVVVAATHDGAPDDLWGAWGASTALQRTEFDDYLAGCQRACAIEIAGAVTFPDAVELEELRRRRDGFVTPQSYRFLGEDETSVLLNGEAQHLAGLPRPSERQMFLY